MSSKTLILIGVGGGFVLAAIGVFLPWTDMGGPMVSGADFASGSFSGGEFGFARAGLVLLALVITIGLASTMLRPLSRSLAVRCLAPIGLVAVLAYAPISSFQVGYVLCVIGLGLAVIARELALRKSPNS